MPAKAGDRPSVDKSEIENLYRQSTLEPNRRAEKLVLSGRNHLVRRRHQEIENDGKTFCVTEARKDKCTITPSDGPQEQACEMQLRNVVPQSAGHPPQID